MGDKIHSPTYDANMCISCLDSKNQAGIFKRYSLVWNFFFLLLFLQPEQENTV